LSSFTTDLEAKRAEVLKELIPNVVRVAGLYNSGNPTHQAQWSVLQAAAQRPGMEPQLLDVRKQEDIARAFDDARARRAEALMVGLDTLTQQYSTQIVELAASYRLPAIYVAKEFVEARGLIAYGPSYPDLYRRAAIYVDRIFRGASPSEPPVEQPTKFEMIVNVGTARTLGISLPPTLLVRADEVVE
jgi:putative ABC transport system substrate-binding protein